jgi:CubicO group peptidase (beta-lactamase class C family)
MERIYPHNSILPWRTPERLISILGLALMLSLIPVLTCGRANAQQRYPGERWDRVKSPEALGWSSERLKLAREYSKSIGSSAVMIIVDGVVLDEWGETAKRFRCHSMRKSFLSALYGIYAKEGKIDLSSTLDELGIDDIDPALTAEEKRAKVIDLLRARSGVYHPAGAETPEMRALRPQRGSHKPGTYWYYNNWDFNALGTIFEQRTKTTIAEAFKQRIAEALRMEDFRLEDVGYAREAQSIHAAYPFRMSARDAARFGLLYLRKGEWRGKQIVPKEWIKESTKPHSRLGESGIYGIYGGYGYMWWVAVDGKHFPGVNLGEGAYSAQGLGGQYIVVVPYLNLVVVHRNNTDVMNIKEINAASESASIGNLLRLIVEAKRS